PATARWAGGATAGAGPPSPVPLRLRRLHPAPRRLRQPRGSEDRVRPFGRPPAAALQRLLLPAAAVGPVPRLRVRLIGLILGHADHRVEDGDPLGSRISIVGDHVEAVTFRAGGLGEIFARSIGQRNWLPAPAATLAAGWYY